MAHTVALFALCFVSTTGHDISSTCVMLEERFKLMRLWL